jgi:GNAT superfamily N-acetyltransferase
MGMERPGLLIDEDWAAHFFRPDIEVWILWSQQEPAGSFELEKEESGSVRITQFGLRSSFSSRGIGGYLLTRALQRAWDAGATKVWLHTSSFDHPHAWSNYQTRGMKLIKMEVLQRV